VLKQYSLKEFYLNFQSKGKKITQTVKPPFKGKNGKWAFSRFNSVTTKFKKWGKILILEKLQ
jgi:hypothetical protein